MYLDDRSHKLLNKLLNDPSITSKKLEKKYNLTRRQLGYSFDKINDWLSAKNFPEIKRTRQGQFIIPPIILTKMTNETIKPIKETYIYSKTQRIYMILLMLLSREEELSLNHFALELDVSRNTILNDLKQAREISSEYSLSIRYSRIKGYVVDGKEFHVRRLLNTVIEKVIQMPNGEEQLKQLALIKNKKLTELSARIERVESKLSLRFTDEKLLIMPYMLLLVLRRVKQGKKINSFNIHYKELSGAKEYQATEEILFDFVDIPKEERLFITLYLLTTNVTWAEICTDERIPDLEQVLDDMLHLFEKRACIKLRDREELLEKLLLHVTPAYYRIKYHLTEEDKAKKLISRDYKELHHIVRQCTQPLANLIGRKIPEVEIAYFTMLIGGWMRRQGESIEEKIKAIVVCPQGVSVSRLMLSELRELFPEFVFLDALSVREFHHYKLEFDIVFSPIFVETDKMLFLASTFLEQEEKRQLRRQVMMELNRYVPQEIDVQEMLEIIKKHAVINNENQLGVELQEYIYPHSLNRKEQQTASTAATLSELITLDNIILRQSVRSWEEAIQITAEPLVNSGHIEPEYVNAVIKHCENDPYIVIGEHMAIPHAAPDAGVNQVSMSLLRIKEGVQFTENHLIHIVVIIAAEDKQKHLKALLQLMDIAQSEEGSTAIINSKTKEEVHALLRDYSSEELSK